MQKQLTIVQQNDTHGHFKPHLEFVWNASGFELKKTRGIGTAAGYVKGLKETNPNLLFMDSGDIFHGTAPLVQSKGDVAVPILNALELDAFVPGNWDFAYGKEQLGKLVKELDASAVACNLLDDSTETPFLEPYVVKKTDNGLKIGVIGLTYPYEDKIMHNHFSEGLIFSKGLEQLPKHIDKLKANENVDLIVVLSHMGLPLDVKLCSEVKGIDVLLSGHSHDRTRKPIVKNGTIIIQSGSHGSFLGRLDLTIENKNVVDYSHQFISLYEPSIPDDQTVTSLVQELFEPYEREHNETVGKTATTLHRMTLEEAPMDRLITDAYLHSVEGDMALSHGWRYGVPVAPGSITLNDLFQIIPTNPELFTVELKGSEIYDMFEANLDHVYARDPYNQMGGYVLRTSGVRMTFKPYNPRGARIQTIFINGRPLDENTTYKIVAAGQQTLKKFEKLKNYQNIHSIEVLKKYISSLSPVDVKMGDIESV
ncbi:bifunctional metallophosphatase/5'-nucleotidase [Pseudalkalibacillus caeni]|uniref:Bifunctional metallophosphatase/5'-nucleotidase n=1 Tax=Exobacillus caeni TaxID=2574798 RepID=A0A5R9F2W4_9BACL|nr:bifunctional metallophosphatase/5'-nucleotidase [Pseudalkalibacillus caeni]TLS36830.1 bifunctional metallophosphatase/5'-nucleotidase [Pseudalkalibacillus caeni]